MHTYIHTIRGRSQLSYTMTLKFAHWQEPPWSLFKMCHRFPEVQVAALEKVILSDPSDEDHPWVTALQGPELIHTYTHTLHTHIHTYITRPRARLPDTPVLRRPRAHGAARQGVLAAAPSCHGAVPPGQHRGAPGRRPTCDVREGCEACALPQHALHIDAAPTEVYS